MAGPELGSAESNDETAATCSDVVSTCDVVHTAEGNCSPSMASYDGMYATPGAVVVGADDCGGDNTPPVTGSDTVLSEDFAALYNKYADKMMGGALSDDTILARVRAKLWKDMKAWRL